MWGSGFKVWASRAKGLNVLDLGFREGGVRFRGLGV